MSCKLRPTGAEEPIRQRDDHVSDLRAAADRAVQPQRFSPRRRRPRRKASVLVVLNTRHYSEPKLEKNAAMRRNPSLICSIEVA